MKIKIHLPRDYEVKSIKVDEKNGTIEIEPRFLRSTVWTTVAYVETVGDGGMEQQALLRASSKSGRVLCQTTAETEDLLFDKTPEEYQQAREAAGPDDDDDDDDDDVITPPPARSVLGDSK